MARTPRQRAEQGEAIEMKDLGIGKLRAAMAELGRTSVTFGYQGATGAEAHPSSPENTVAQVAAFAEYGTTSSPARPLGQHTMDANRDAFVDATKRALSDLIDGRAADAEAVAQSLGELALTALRKTIDTSREWAEANAESTIRAKGHDQPLIGERAKLYENASYAVRRDGQIVKQSEDTG